MTPTDLAPSTQRRLFRTRGGRNLSFTALGFGSAPLGNYTRPLAEEEADGILAAAWRSGSQRSRTLDEPPVIMMPI